MKKWRVWVVEKSIYVPSILKLIEGLEKENAVENFHWGVKETLRFYQLLLQLSDSGEITLSSKAKLKLKKIVKENQKFLNVFERELFKRAFR
jgi:hypothetical protein